MQHFAPLQAERDGERLDGRLKMLGDPVGARRAVLPRLATEGAVMIVEPFVAHEHVEDNLTAVGRVYSAASTLICVPTSLAQPVRQAWARWPARRGAAGC